MDNLSPEEIYLKRRRAIDEAESKALVDLLKAMGDLNKMLIPYTTDKDRDVASQAKELQGRVTSVIHDMDSKEINRNNPKIQDLIQDIQKFIQKYSQRGE